MNLLLCTDVYKFGHLYQYPKGTTKVYSYLQARVPNVDIVFYGLQYYLKKYLNPISCKDVDEFISTVETILGANQVERAHYDDLVELGYLPIEIRAIPEGSVIPSQNVLMTITNTRPEFYWLVGFLESLLLKVWNSCTVATNSYQLKKVCKSYAEKTCDDLGHLPFQIHDFGYRGCSSEETAAISGSAHLLSFYGTDTVPAVSLIKKFYKPKNNEPVGLSVPATEHSVMSAYGRENEFQAFEAILEKYPKGIVSIVSDTYNLWNVLINFVPKLRERILAHDGKVVFRPDSGNPIDIICGENPYSPRSSKDVGALQILWDQFGGHVNKKGFKVLNPQVGLIYGDGIYPDRMRQILDCMASLGFASSNIVFGIGGLLLQNFSRDTYGFTMKATQVVVNGEERAIEKDPITDSKKKSHRGYLALRKLNGKYITIDGLTQEQAEDSLLVPVYKDGLLNEQSFDEIRKNLVTLENNTKY